MEHFVTDMNQSIQQNFSVFDEAYANLQKYMHLDPPFVFDEIKLNITGYLEAFYYFENKATSALRDNEFYNALIFCDEAIKICFDRILLAHIFNKIALILHKANFHGIATDYHLLAYKTNPHQKLCDDIFGTNYNKRCCAIHFHAERKRICNKQYLCAFCLYTKTNMEDENSICYCDGLNFTKKAPQNIQDLTEKLRKLKIKNFKAKISKRKIKPNMSKIQRDFDAHIAKKIISKRNIVHKNKPV